MLGLGLWLGQADMVSSYTNLLLGLILYQHELAIKTLIALSVCLSYPCPNARWQHSHSLRHLPDTNYMKSSRSICGVKMCF